jgi:hypothetical protein
MAVLGLDENRGVTTAILGLEIPPDLASVD